MQTSQEFPSIVSELQKIFPPETGMFLVGGAVRDAILGRPIHDLDMVLPGDGVSAARKVASALNVSCYPLDSERGVGRVILVRDQHRFTIDFASLRGERIEADLTQRDFTINAIALPLHRLAEKVDPLSGEADAHNGIIRLCTESAIADDPVRAIRAIRLAVHLGFRIESGTKEQIRTHATGLGRIPGERIRDEFFRILGGPKVAVAIRSLDALGLLAVILPEITGLDKVLQTGPKDPSSTLTEHDAQTSVWGHTLGVVDRLETLIDLLCSPHKVALSADIRMGTARATLGRFQQQLAEHLSRFLADERPAKSLLFLASLLHDAGKPETRTVDPHGEIHFLGHEQLGADWALRRSVSLRLSREESEYVAQIVRQHMRPLLLQRGGGTVTRRAVFRYFRSTGPSGVEACLHSLADTLANFGMDLSQETWTAGLEVVRTLWEGYFEHPTDVVQPIPVLTGNDLIREFDLAPGPQVGELLSMLREAQAAGEIETRDEAIQLVSRGLGRKGE